MGAPCRSLTSFHRCTNHPSYRTSTSFPPTAGTGRGRRGCSSWGSWAGAWRGPGPRGSSRRCVWCVLDGGLSVCVVCAGRWCVCASFLMGGVCGGTGPALLSSPLLSTLITHPSSNPHNTTTRKRTAQRRPRPALDQDGPRGGVPREERDAVEPDEAEGPADDALPGEQARVTEREGMPATGSREGRKEGGPEAWG